MSGVVDSTVVSSALGVWDNFPPQKLWQKRLKFLICPQGVESLIFLPQFPLVENCPTHLVLLSMPRRRSCVAVIHCSPGLDTLLMADCESAMISQMSWSNHHCRLGLLIHRHLVLLWRQRVNQLEMLIINISRSRICSGLEPSWRIGRRRIDKSER